MEHRSPSFTRIRRIPKVVVLVWVCLLFAVLFDALGTSALAGDDVALGRQATNHTFLFGVTVDTPRHEFSVEWLQSFVTDLHRMGFTAIHLPLTASTTPGDLRRLAQYARSLDMVILPGVSLPSLFAAEFVPSCPNYICSPDRGIPLATNLPLDIRNPKLPARILSILKELLEALDRPPYLHLGDYKAVETDGCWKEANRAVVPEYDSFDTTLEGILANNLGYRPHVIRSVRDANDDDHQRRTTNEYSNAPPYLQQPIEWNLATTLSKDHPTGWEVYQQSLAVAMRYRHNEPLLVSTPAMTPEWFATRNIPGRLLAISMAFGPHDYKDRAEFEAAYTEACHRLFSSRIEFCSLLGGLSGIDEQEYRVEYSRQWTTWAIDSCHKLTENRDVLEWQVPFPARVHAIQDEAFAAYWEEESSLSSSSNTYHAPDEPAAQSRPVRLLHELFESSVVPIRGLIVDLVETPVSISSLETTLLEDVMAPLGFNTLQLSLMNRLGSVLGLQESSSSSSSSLKHLYFSAPKPYSKDYPLSEDRLKALVASGKRLGIDLVPEISITTDATGWYHAGFVVPCPKTLCQQQHSEASLPNDVRQGTLLPLILHVIGRLSRIFPGPFLHLGSDEREASRACWIESGQTVPAPTASFEQTLGRLLQARNRYKASNILRWENREGIVYPHRIGSITHYRYNNNRNDTGIRDGPTNGNRKETSSLDSNAVQEFVFGSLIITPEADPWIVYQETRAWVDRRPKGLLAKISLAARTEPRQAPIITKNQKKALLAFAAGLSSQAPFLEDPAALDAYSSDLCFKSKNDGRLYQSLCSPFRDKPEERSSHRKTTAAVDRELLLCRAMTKSVTRPRMRSDALLPSDHGDRSDTTWKDDP